MADYTIANFKRMPDTAGEHAPQLESRFGRKHLDSKHLGVSYFRYAPGFRLETGHSHREQEEVYVVVSGSGRAKLGDEVIELAMWDALRVAPAVIRSFEAGPDGMELLCIGGRKPDGPDSERFPDFWP